MHKLELSEQKKYMRMLYKDVSGYFIPKTEEQQIKNAKSSAVYGEITFSSLNKALEKVNLGPKDVFYDLGSGVGKVIMQAALAGGAKSYIGLELSKLRYDASIKALQMAKDLKIIKNASKVNFYCEDFLQADLSKATVIYTCSTAFSIKFMALLAEKLSSLKKGLRVISLQDFPEGFGFELLEVMKLDMTWTRKTSVYFYELKK
jgi:SAM-dependent methyltransferase